MLHNIVIQVVFTKGAPSTLFLFLTCKRSWTMSIALIGLLFLEFFEGLGGKVLPTWVGKPGG